MSDDVKDVAWEDASASEMERLSAVMAVAAQGRCAVCRKPAGAVSAMVARFGDVVEWRISAACGHVASRGQWEADQTSALVGEVVLYRLTHQDADEVNRRRTTPASIQDRITRRQNEWPVGVQAHIGREVKAGDVYPMLVTADQGQTALNGQVFLDGTDTLWVLNRPQGSGQGSWLLKGGR